MTKKLYKPLLRVLPSLTGNIRIGCKIDDIYRKSKDTLYTYVRNVSLMPSVNTNVLKKINVNLLNSTYEYDIRRFYQSYKGSFYDSSFNFDKQDYQYYDSTDAFRQDTRNMSYEFGCRRLSYASTGYQFEFFAPIYIENDILPDTFNIEVSIKGVLKKTLKIYISENAKDDKNYLYNYLYNYVKKLDDNIIFCNSDDDSATIFGIDCANGGFTETKDFLIVKNYKKQMTLNNFDNNICQTFQRNTLVCKQIIPLSFSFNINDLLTDEEILKYANYNFSIHGYYTKKNIKTPFYDFSIDYEEFCPKYNIYDMMSNNLKIVPGINIMKKSDIGSLDEAEYKLYKYTNKLTPNYCRWKLKYTSDEYPYVINNSLSFTYNNPIKKYINDNTLDISIAHKYGDYPILSGLDTPRAKLNANKDNIIFPIDQKTFTNYIYDTTNEIYNDDIDIQNVINYIKGMSNHLSNWFEVIDKDPIENISEIEWGEVDTNTNQIYYKGILYDFNKLNNDNIHPSKFAVFVKPVCDIVDDETISKRYVTGNTIMCKDDESEYNTQILSQRNATEIVNSKVNRYVYEPAMLPYDKDVSSSGVEVDTVVSNGLNVEACGTMYEIYDYDEETIPVEYLDNNTYFVENQSYDFGNTFYDFNDLASIIPNVNIFEQYAVHGTKLLEIKDITNLYDFKQNKWIFNNNEAYDWIVDNIYVVSLNNISIKLSEYIQRHLTITEYNNDIQFIMVDQLFVPIFTIYDIVSNISDIEPQLYQLHQYHLHKQFSRNNVDIVDVFVPDVYSKFNKDIVSDIKVLDHNLVYVDQYNLKGVFPNDNNIKRYIDSGPRSIKYAQFIDKRHVIEYLNECYKDYNNNDLLPISIYNRHKFIVYDETLKNIKIANSFGLYRECNSQEDILSLLYEIEANLSNSRNVNGMFEMKSGDNAIELDLVYKKEFLVLPKMMVDAINVYGSSLSDMIPLQIFKTEDYADSTYMHSYGIQHENIENIDVLVPVFDNIYETYGSCASVSEFVNINTTTITDTTDQEYVLYKSHTLGFTEYISSSFINALNDKKHQYLDINEFQKYLESIIIYKVIDHSIDITEYTPLVDSCTLYDTLYTYVDNNNEQYAFYYIPFKFENTNEFFNVRTNTFKYINGVPVDDSKFISSIFDIMCIFLKEPLFNKVSLPALVKPTQYQYKIDYYVDPTSHNIIFNKRNINVTLYRYFGYIKPLFEKTNKALVYELKLKDSENIVFDSNNISKKYVSIDTKPKEYVYTKIPGIIKQRRLLSIDVPSININNGEKRYPIKDKQTYDEFQHFNGNKFWNLTEYFEIDAPGTYTYEDILSLESEEHALEVFIGFFEKNKFKTMPEDKSQMLFLYNKYTVNFLTAEAPRNISTIKKYKLTYQFILK